MICGVVKTSSVIGVVLFQAYYLGSGINADTSQISRTLLACGGLVSGNHDNYRRPVNTNT